MKYSDLSGKSLEELKKMLLSARSSQFRYRMQKATSQLKQTHLIGEVKADIAKLKTAIRQEAGKSNG